MSLTDKGKADTMETPWMTIVFCRVMMQIVQELCKRPGLNKTGFDMPTIYVPNPNKQVRCVNQIEEVCKDIEKTITQTIQNTLNSLEKDCDTFGDPVDQAITRDNQARADYMKAFLKGGFLYMLTLTLPLAMCLSLALAMLQESLLVDLLGKEGMELLKFYISPVKTFWAGIPMDYQVWAGVGLVVITMGLMMLARWTSRTTTTLSRRQKRQLLDKQEYVRSVVKNKKASLYSEYLQQTVSDQDM